MEWLAVVMATVWTNFAAVATPVMVLPVTGAIGPASAAYVIRDLQQARDQGMQLIVLQMDTPGGLDASMCQVIQAILTSSMPMAGYVVPDGARTASVGTYILYARRVAAMTPVTSLGAAPPVTIGMSGHALSPSDGAEPANTPSASPSNEDTLAHKQMHDAAAYIRGPAQLRGHNTEWAERAVREAVSLDATEAVSQYVIDLIVASLPDLLKQVDSRAACVSIGDVTLRTAEATTITSEPDWYNHFLGVIIDPSLAPLLLTVGMYALIFEFLTPGMAVPDILGAVCIVVALYGPQILPISYVGLALTALGLGCTVAGASLSMFGAFSMSGIITFVLSMVMLIDTQTPDFGVPLPLITGLASVSLVVVLALPSLAMCARRRPIVTSGDTSVGMTGEIVSVDTPGADADNDGWARIHGER